MSNTKTKSPVTSIQLPIEVPTIQRTVSTTDIVRMYVSEWELGLNAKLKTLQKELGDINKDIKERTDLIINKGKEIVQAKFSRIGNDDVRQTVRQINVTFDCDKGEVNYSLYLETVVDGDKSSTRISTKLSDPAPFKVMIDKHNTDKKRQSDLTTEISKVRTELSQISMKERQVSAIVTKKAMSDAGIDANSLVSTDIQKLLEG